MIQVQAQIIGKFNRPVSISLAGKQCHSQIYPTYQIKINFKLQGMQRQKEGSRKKFPQVSIDNIGSLYSNAEVAKQRYQHIVNKFKEQYNEDPQFIARAPGRVDIFGGHIDYQGYPVLPMAIEMDCLIAVKAKPGQKQVKLGHVNSQKYPQCQFLADPQLEKQKPVFKNDYAKYYYGGYKAGIVNVKRQQLVGMNVILEGNIPLAAGLSSSSALCVCSALASLRANKVEEYTREEFTETVIQFERAVGAACGGMDQVSSVMGQDNCCLFIEFNPIRSEIIHLPKGSKFVVTNTLVVNDKLNKAASSLNKKDCECRMATQLLAKNIGVAKQTWKKFKVLQHLEGFLKLSSSNMARLVQQFLQKKPYTRTQIQSLLQDKIENILGDIPLWDVVVQYNQHFMLHHVAFHIYNDSDRQLKFIEICKSQMDDQFKLRALGKLQIDAQHSSSQNYGNSCPELDQITSLAIDSGAYGSKLLGAGGGGCAVSLVNQSKTQDFIKQIKQKYYSQEKFAKTLEQIGIENAIFQVKPSLGACLINL